MKTLNEQCAIGFIENIWNNSRFEMAAEYLHQDFCDHSLPDYCQNKYGLILYLKALGKEILHQTLIEELVCEGDLVMLRFNLLTTGKLPTGEEKSMVSGYRYLRMSGNKIKDHWELIQSIEPYSSGEQSFAN